MVAYFTEASVKGTEHLLIWCGDHPGRVEATADLSGVIHGESLPKSMEYDYGVREDDAGEGTSAVCSRSRLIHGAGRVRNGKMMANIHDSQSRAIPRCEFCTTFLSCSPSHSAAKPQMMG